MQNMKVVRCPNCNKAMMDIQSGSKPFKPCVTEVAIQIKCSRCGSAIRVELGNA